MRIEHIATTAYFQIYGEVNGHPYDEYGTSLVDALERLFVTLRFDGVGEWEQEPDVTLVEGMCYNLDCDEDRCRCWNNIDALKIHVLRSQELQRKFGVKVYVDENREVHIAKA